MHSIAHPILSPVSDQEGFQALVIMGATASGKTQLALDLGKHVSIEVISVDSVQVYRGMDIGTAKASKEEQKLVLHHLIDVRSVNGSYHLAAFLHDVERVLIGVLERGALPVFVGGSGFYFEGLFCGLPPLPPANQKIRSQLERELEMKGVHVLYEKLQLLDPQAACVLSKGDRHKIIRALEVIEQTGQPITALRRQKEMKGKGIGLRARLVRLEEERSVLRQKVLQRCDFMLEQGLVQEVEDLISYGLKENQVARNAIGYRHFLDYLDGQLSFEESVYFFKKVSCQLIKKQETWSRSRNRLIPVEILSSLRDRKEFIKRICFPGSCS